MLFLHEVQAPPEIICNHRKGSIVTIALEKFSVYVDNGRKLTVFTDHNPLKFVNSMKNRNMRLMRWCLNLQKYDIAIKHIKGKDNLIADALSRSV